MVIVINKKHYEANELIAYHERLEKENAELKDALKGKRCNCMTYLNFKDLEKKLTKAEELLNKLLCLLDDFAEDEIDSGGRDFMEQARQFLKEIEK